MLQRAVSHYGDTRIVNGFQSPQRRGECCSHDSYRVVSIRRNVKRRYVSIPSTPGRVLQPIVSHRPDVSRIGQVSIPSTPGRVLQRIKARDARGERLIGAFQSPQRRGECCSTIRTRNRTIRFQFTRFQSPQRRGECCSIPIAWFRFAFMLNMFQSPQRRGECCSRGRTSSRKSTLFCAFQSPQRRGECCSFCHSRNRNGRPAKTVSIPSTPGRVLQQGQGQEDHSSHEDRAGFNPLNAGASAAACGRSRTRRAASSSRFQSPQRRGECCSPGAPHAPAPVKAAMFQSPQRRGECCSLFSAPAGTGITFSRFQSPQRRGECCSRTAEKRRSASALQATQA